jgi:hypothetical protein
VSDEIRFSKIDDAIQRLASVSADLSKMLAVHELRLTQQERSTDQINFVIEKRREDLELRLKEVYETMKEEDGAILQEIKKSRDASNTHYERLEAKVTKLERLSLLITGSAITVGFIIGMVEKYFKIFS